MNPTGKYILSIMATIFLSSGIVYGWSGLVASDGDTLTYTKWNELFYLAEVGRFVDGIDINDASFTGGSVGIGTNSPSDGSGSGGQDLWLDVEGAIGAEYYCDKDGLNCIAAVDLGSSGGSIWTQTGSVAHYTTGNVGIGTTFPDGQTEISSSSDENYAGGFNPFTQRAKLLITDTSDTVTYTTPASIIAFKSGSAGVAEGYIGLVRNSANSGDLVFGASLGATRTEKMRIGSSGNVGIGDSSPNERLEINGQISGGFGAITTAGTINWNHVTNARSGNGHTLLLGTHANGPGVGGYYHPFSFEYSSKNGSGNMAQFAIPYNSAGQNNGIYMRTRYSGTWQNWSKILSENTSGRVGIGKTNPSDVLDVNGHIRLSNANSYIRRNSTSGYMILASGTSNGNGASLQMYGKDSASSKGYMYLNTYDVAAAQNSWVFRDYNGSVWSTEMLLQDDGDLYIYGSATTCVIGNGVGGTSCTSDKRYKKDITTYKNALEKIGKIRGVTYRWNDKSPYKDTSTQHIGVIAQEVQTVFPEAVQEITDDNTGDAHLTVNMETFVPVLIESVKELWKEVSLYFNKTDEQQKEINQLTQRINTLEKLLNQE